MHTVVAEPIEHLNHEHAPSCEMEFRVSARDFDRCEGRWKEMFTCTRL